MFFLLNITLLKNDYIVLNVWQCNDGYNCETAFPETENKPDYERRPYQLFYIKLLSTPEF